MLKFNIFTLFPEIYPGPFGYSIMRDAISKGIFELNVIDIKNYGYGKHKLIDDKIYGGGSGMLLRPDVIEDALLDNGVKKGDKIICMSAKGKKFNQRKAANLSKLNEVNIICPRYEGVDQRFIDEYEVEEYSIGDYVLSNGDISAYIVVDAIVRNLDGVLGDENSLVDESFSIDEDGLLVEYPQYTKPNIWQDREVPQVLLSGNHGEIEKWRKQQSIEYTKKNRDDLYSKYINKIK